MLVHYVFPGLFTVHILRNIEKEYGDKLDIRQLDNIIKKTIEAIDKSKSELFDVSEVARKEKKRIEEDFELSKHRVIELANDVKAIEDELIESKRKLLYANKYYEKFSEEQKKSVYERTETLRVELAVKRELEQIAIQRRNELELRLRDAIKMVERTEKLISAIGSAMNFLTGDLQSVTEQLEDIQHRQSMGIKIIKAQEEERQRVAREIHDGPAQSMSNVVLKAEICEKVMDADIDAARKEIKNLKAIVKESLQDVRRIIYDLRPMSLDDLGLIPTLQRYVNSYVEQNEIPVVFRTRGSADNLKPVVSLTIFRIMQEALSNIHKYANARNVTVNLEFLQEETLFTITDDGKGFDIEEVKKKHLNINGGFGLFSMRERVELLQGRFEITSEKGKGTRITARIPMIVGEGSLNG